MKFEAFDYTISDHFLVCLEYGDTSHMSEEEEAQFDDWLAEQWENAKKQFPNAVAYHWSIGEGAGFCRCEITGLHSTCYYVKMMVAIKDSY